MIKKTASGLAMVSVLVLFVAGAEQSRRSRSLRNQHVAASPACEVCATEEKIEAHHIIPLVFGGLDESENLITLCHHDHIVWGHHGNTSRLYDPDIREHIRLWKTWAKEGVKR